MNVGGGAAKIVREAVGKPFEEGKSYDQTALLQDLGQLHHALLQALELNFVEMICPRGWSIDLTEHACCERRRYDDAVAKVAAGNRPKRMRDEAGSADRQSVRCRRLRACWQALCFKALPSRATV